MNNQINELAVKVKNLTKELSGAANTTVKRGSLKLGKDVISFTVKHLAPKGGIGAMGYLPRKEIVIQLPTHVSQMVTEFHLDLQSPISRTVMGVNQIAAQFGMYPVFTKPAGIKKVYSISLKSMVEEVKYLAVDQEFVVKHNGLSAKGEEGIAAVLNFLHAKGIIPVDYVNCDRAKLGAFSKYLNHDWAGTLQDVYMCVLPKKVTVLGVEADGHAYVNETIWTQLITGFGILPWKPEKVADLKHPRVIKPVALGSVYGKGTLVPLSDAVWNTMFPGIPATVNGKPTIVADRNFCKLVDPSKKPNAKGNTWLVSKLGLHDSPMFGIKKVMVKPSTMVRMSLTNNQIETWAEIVQANLLELEYKIQQEGPEFLALRNIFEDDGEYGASNTLDKDAWLTQGILRNSDAVKARKEAMAGLMETSAAIPAYQFSGYAVAPTKELALLYANGTVSHLDCFVNPLDYAEFLALDGMAELTNSETLFVIGRFPAINPMAFHQGKLIPSTLVPRRGIVCHPVVGLPKALDYDGDTLNVRFYPDFKGLGHTYSLKDIQSVPLAKGANATEFPAGDYARIMVQQIYCQSATGLVDSAALSALVSYTNSNPAVVPYWAPFEIPAEDLQTLLTGAKKAVELPECAIKGKDLWLKIISGKDTGWQNLSSAQVIESLVKLDKKGNLRNTPIKYTMPTFTKAIESAIELAFTIEVKAPEYVFAPGKASIPLLSELRALDNAIRPDGLHYVDGSHSIAVETIRLYMKRIFKKASGATNPNAVANAMSSYVGFVADLAADTKSREAALHWAQKLLGDSLNKEAPELCYHLIAKEAA